MGFRGKQVVNTVEDSAVTKVTELGTAKSGHFSSRQMAFFFVDRQYR